MFKKFFSFITLIFSLFSVPTMPFSEQPKETETTLHNNEIVAEEVTEASVESTTAVINETTTVFFEETTTHSETEFCTTINHTIPKANSNIETTIQKEISTEENTTTKNTTTTVFFEETTSVEKNLSEQTNNYYPEADVIELYNMVNMYRKNNGLEELTLDPELCQLAYIRAQEQAVSKGHTRPDGTRFITVFTEYGYKCKTGGENIVISSYRDIDRMFNNWKNSETHNENMLKSKWAKTGIALYRTEEGRYCFVQLFATAN